MRVPDPKAPEVHGVISTSKLIGEVVVDPRGEDLGQIQELVIDARDGRLAYAIVSFAGFLARGNKLFVLPWGAFFFSRKENRLVLNVDKQRLETAPGFDRDAERPDFADRNWGRRLSTYYDCAPYWAV
ncbi:MAG: hypothetical protein FD129_842 [bacterium]|nr:MAG: hypothetical protein FD129_842 [bacterium]